MTPDLWSPESAASGELGRHLARYPGPVRAAARSSSATAAGWVGIRLREGRGCPVKISTMPRCRPWGARGHASTRDRPGSTSSQRHPGSDGAAPREREPSGLSRGPDGEACAGGQRPPSDARPPPRSFRMMSPKAEPRLPALMRTCSGRLPDTAMTRSQLEPDSSG
jgi:hypothetical protein